LDNAAICTIENVLSLISGRYPQENGVSASP
jgi:hypothetical protein